MKYGTRIVGPEESPEVYFFIGVQSFRLDIRYDHIEETPLVTAERFAGLVGRALSKLAESPPAENDLQK